MPTIRLNGRDVEVTPDMQLEFDRRMSDMLQSRTPPGSKTQGDFYKGRGTLADQLAPHELAVLDKVCEARGFRPSINSVYQPGLARWAFDEQAFVSGDVESHVKAICEDRDCDSDGYVKIKRGKRNTKDPMEHKRTLGKKLIQDTAPSVVAEDPSLRGKSYNEISEAVIDKHGY